MLCTEEVLVVTGTITTSETADLDALLVAMATSESVIPFKKVVFEITEPATFFEILLDVTVTTEETIPLAFSLIFVEINDDDLEAFVILTCDAKVVIVPRDFFSENEFIFGAPTIQWRLSVKVPGMATLGCPSNRDNVGLDAALALEWTVVVIGDL